MLIKDHTVAGQGQNKAEVPELQGEYYVEVLSKLHGLLQPETYLEIGCYTGGSLAVSNAKTIAIDPSLRIEGHVINNKTVCMIFQMTSDKFFQKYDPSKLLGQTIDMAFLDGMHLAEFLLRDFINVEKYCKKNSIIFLHDCVPVDVTITDRHGDTPRRAMGSHPQWWAGDVWKTVSVLKSHRPDLHITAWDAQPTGLIAITNLNPLSTILSENYFELIKPFEKLDLMDYGIERFFSELNLQSTSDTLSLESIAARFWL